MRILFFVCICFVFPILGIAQQDAKVDPINITPLPGLTEVAIGVSNLKTTELNEVKVSLKHLKGVTWAGFCEDQFYIFLYVDRAKQPDNKAITDAILQVNKSLKIYFKTASFTLLLNNCRDKEKAMTR